MYIRQKGKVCMAVAVICIFGSAQASFASSLERYLTYNMNAAHQPLFAQTDQNSETFNYQGSESEENTCWMTMGQAHKYFGYSTLVLAGLAAVSGGDNGFHKGAGIGAAAMAVGACATGFMEYSNYFDLGEGMSKHNIHIVLGTLAAVGFVVTAASAINSDNTSHAGIGIASTAAAAIPVIMIKF